MKKTTLLKTGSMVAGFMLPVAFAFAQTLNTGFVFDLFDFVKDILSEIPPILVAIAGVVFMFEVVRYIFAGKDGKAEEKETIRKHIMWSLVALVVLLTFWGITRAISNTLGLSRGEAIGDRQIPTVKI
jgi:ABC-type amino acid transport system permease subunit